MVEVRPIDAMFQTAGITGDAEAIPLLTLIHIRLFGPETGAMIVRQSLGEPQKNVLAKGRTRGGKGLVEFSCTSGANDGACELSVEQHQAIAQGRLTTPVVNRASVS